MWPAGGLEVEYFRFQTHTSVLCEVRREIQEININHNIPLFVRQLKERQYLILYGIKEKYELSYRLSDKYKKYMPNITIYERNTNRIMCQCLRHNYVKQGQRRRINMTL
jgi:hypothetical protein